MACDSSPEVKSILIRTHDLMVALSNEPLSVAGILLGRGFISDEIMSKMLIVSYTPAEKATILIEAVRNKIDLSPSKFTELLEILSEQTCAKDVAEILRSTYQSELTKFLTSICVVATQQHSQGMALTTPNAEQAYSVQYTVQYIYISNLVLVLM